MLIFNPEHDLCLANGDANFVPPASALQFGKDCATLLELLFEDDITSNQHLQIMAWGWNPAIKNRLLKEGIPAEQLPTDKHLLYIKQLQHRRTAKECFNYIKSRFTCELLIQELPMECYSTDDITAFVTNYRNVVLKAPWSGSGKGLRWITDAELSLSDIGWCKQTIAKQGSVMAEVRREVVQDFAMLFYVSAEPQHSVSFVGYSLFSTHNGTYSSNILASDNKILELLSQYVPTDVVLHVKDSVTEFLRGLTYGKYSGYIGVDMFVCKGNDETPYLINPCVEINFRMTMGVVAKRYFNKYLIHTSQTEEDGSQQLKVVFARSADDFRSQTANALWMVSNTADRLLQNHSPHGYYAVIVSNCRQ